MSIKIRLKDGTVIECSSASQAAELLVAMGKEEAPRSGAPASQEADLQPNRFKEQSKGQRFHSSPLGMSQKQMLNKILETLYMSSPNELSSKRICELAEIQPDKLKVLKSFVTRLLFEQGITLQDRKELEQYISNRSGKCDKSGKMETLWKLGEKADLLFKALSQKSS